MALNPFDPPWDYLQHASPASLQSFELSRLNHAANIRHEMTALMNQWLEETAQAMLARWLLDNREAMRDSRDAMRDAKSIENDLDIPLPESLPTGARPKLVRAVRGKSRAANGTA